MINWNGVSVLWERELKRYWRSKSRIISSIAMPLLMLISFGMGFKQLSIAGIGSAGYINFLVPGLIAFSLMTSSLMGGMSILWDREFGFLKEIMVSPINRLSIVIGRVAGGTTTSLIQGLLIMLISMLFGFNINLISIIPFILIMGLISVLFMGFGLLLSSIITDIQGFGSIMSLIVMPLFFLSGTFYPLKGLPFAVQLLSFLDPMSYGVDALRAINNGVSSFGLMNDLIILTILSVILISISTYLFNKSESV